MRALILLLLLPSLAVAETTPDPPPVEAPNPLAPLLAEALVAFRAWRATIDPETLARWHPAVTVGRAGQGRLLFGLPMPGGPGLHVLSPDESWTTPEVARTLLSLAAEVAEAHPEGPELVVLDIARHGGGRFRPHRSHQDGRDVDLRYYLTGWTPGDYEYRHVTPANFDTPRVWELLWRIYQQGVADRVFVDYRHQRRLYQYARKELKLTPEALEPVLSYPKAQYRKEALIRHVPGHHNHLHVRFHSPIAQALGRTWTLQDAQAVQRTLDLRRTGQFSIIVQSGDTLSGLASMHGVKLADLRRWNRLDRGTILRPGRVLKVIRETGAVTQ
ncbi:MAG: penicillin-insensitive murein endopeptidase [Myxococcales bacterium]|nr:penicillin-insensitive murein endopeptidase [Myxococcales bacterium]